MQLQLNAVHCVAWCDRMSVCHATRCAKATKRIRVLFPVETVLDPRPMVTGESRAKGLSLFLHAMQPSGDYFGLLLCEAETPQRNRDVLL